ncbi:hypothetical protein OAA55_00450 [bacterium]|nr:hypothetical protein [bacterium]
MKINPFNVLFLNLQPSYKSLLSDNIEFVDDFFFLGKGFSGISSHEYLLNPVNRYSAVPSSTILDIDAIKSKDLLSYFLCAARNKTFKDLPNSYDTLALLYNQYHFFVQYLSANSIKLAINCMSLSTGYDYALYWAACKCGVDFLYAEHTSFGKYFYFKPSLDSSFIQNPSSDLLLCSLKSDLTLYYRSLEKRNYWYTSIYTSNKAENQRYNLLQTIKHTTASLKTFHKIRTNNNLTKINSLPPELLISANKLSDKCSKYGVFFLHYQPEATTQFYGTAFSDQLEAFAKFCIICDRNDVTPLLKEHPHRSLKYTRTSLFYAKAISILQMYSGYMLSSATTSSNSLISNSAFVSSVTGTVCLEASLLGVPSYIFGSAWFSYSSPLITAISDVSPDDYVIPSDNISLTLDSFISSSCKSSFIKSLFPGALRSIDLNWETQSLDAQTIDHTLKSLTSILRQYADKY